MNIIYNQKFNLYDFNFFIEYQRVKAITRKINEKLGFPIYKVKIDLLNSELRVENRFSYNESQISKFLKENKLIQERIKKNGKKQ